MRIAADYTTRANYQENYRKSNRDAINARKRAWRASKKAVPHLLNRRIGGQFFECVWCGFVDKQGNQSLLQDACPKAPK
jgi:hypothetical protein